MSDSGPVSRFAALRSERLGDDGGFARLYAAFLAARAALGLVLLLAQVGAWMASGNRHPMAFWVCLAYAGLTLAHALVPRLRRAGGRRSFSGLRRPRWWASVGLDLAAFTTLQALDAGGGVSLAALFILPVMMSGVLSSRRAALASAALATLGLLGALLPQGWDSAELGTRLTQAGLAGSGYFAVALLALELASRLAREQQAAKGSLAFARQQTALNQLVIDEMQEGVLVVDRGLKVRAANPAARALLGEREALHEPQFSLHDHRAWAELVARVSDCFAARASEPLDVTLNFSQAPARTLRVRSRVNRGREDRGSEDLCVLLLEDRATLLARVRRDKLAAMGRMSAGIAHEIRNPLAAISQANALLSEDLPDAAAQRLTGLVAANVRRLQRIVDEVMLLAASPEGAPQVLDAVSLLAEVSQEWAATQDLPQPECLRVDLTGGPQRVQFDPEHLRRVLVNLLDNAWRHAQEAALAAGEGGLPWVGLSLSLQGRQALRLRVFNPGPRIAPSVERHLFEPFYSTRSRGSGLGLYICRELCERYRARIDYQGTQEWGQDGNAFDVLLQRAPENPDS